MKFFSRVTGVALVVITLLSACAVASAGGEYRVSTSGGRLNMRKDASTSATIILYIPNGTAVDDKSEYATKSVTGWKYIGSWGYVSGEEKGYNHYKNGWVMSKYLK